MRLLVTGAGGFLGRYTVAEALGRGHAVRALIRPASDEGALPWHGHPRVEPVRADLRARAGLDAAVDGVDAVVHLAADKAGSLYAQLAANAVGTERLLDAMTAQGVGRMVHVSTMSVYDYRRLRTGASVDERTPLESEPAWRDAYAQSKLVQERLVVEHAAAHGWRLTVLRPGVVFGRGELFNAHLGAELGPGRWLAIGRRAEIPLVYVENCAQAIVLAAERDEAAGRALNVVDDERPTQKRYLDLLLARVRPRPRVIPVPWPVMRAAAALAQGVNVRLLGGRAQVPGILIPARLDARCKPLAFDNRAAREALGWRPRYGLEQALERCCGGRPLPEVPEVPAERGERRREGAGRVA